MTVTGLHITTNKGPCIDGSHVHDVHIHDNRIGPCGASSEGVGIAVENDVHDILIEYNSFDDVASGYYTSSNGDNHVFDHNHLTRVRGPMPRGQMVQFNTVTGSGIRVTCNVSDQTSPGYEAGPEDHVSPFNSSGTATSPLFIAYNKIRGGGPNMSGGGILAGDYGGQYVHIHRNILIDPGQYGLAIAGGHHHVIDENIVFSPDALPWNNSGLHIWAHSENDWEDQSLVTEGATALWNSVFPECQ